MGPTRSSSTVSDLAPVVDCTTTTITTTTNTNTRIKLSDGRHVAYRERGVDKDKANYKVVIVHGFGSSKEMSFLAPQELIEELGIYFLLFDRAGYGESDPNPKGSVKSEAMDIQELADHLELGDQFYVIGVSMGAYPTWGCLKHIPHRLAGVALIVPTVNYRWPSLPKSLIRDDWRRNLEKLRQRGVFDTLRQDFMLAFGEWDFDPMDIVNPFPQNKNSVHIWQGYEDRVVPFQLQRYVSKKLPWIRYHEVPDGGHLIVHYNGICEAILKALLIGEAPLFRSNAVAVQL
ncbi:hypothetical protein ACFE04_027080 [Oxalis oulophora]